MFVPIKLFFILIKQIHAATVRPDPKTMFGILKHSIHTIAAERFAVFLAMLKTNECLISRIEQVKTYTKSPNPQVMLTIFKNTSHIYITEAVRIIFIVFISGKLILCSVKHI